MRISDWSSDVCSSDPCGLTEGAEFLASPHAYMAAMHENFPPVYYNTSPNIGNAWHVTRYEDAYFVLRHPEIFSSHGSVGFPRDPRDWFYFIPLEIDPPDHRQFRSEDRRVGNDVCTTCRSWCAP